MADQVLNNRDGGRGRGRPAQAGTSVDQSPAAAATPAFAADAPGFPVILGNCLPRSCVSAADPQVTQ